MVRWAAAAVVGVVLLAGCGAVTELGGSAPGSTPTVTPAPVPDEPPSPGDVPGVSPDGTVDPDRLARAHSEFLGAWSYTWVYRLVRTEPGTTSLNLTRRVLVGDGATLVRSGGSGPSATNQTIYLTNRSGYQRVGIGGRYETRQLAMSRQSGTFAVAPNVLRRRLPDEGYRTRGVERSGRQYLELYHPPEEPLFEVSGNDTGDGSTPGSGTASGGPPENYTVVAYLTHDGFVRSLSVSYEDANGGRVSVGFEYSDVGNTSVTEPEWVDRPSGSEGGLSPPRRSNATDTGDAPAPGAGGRG